MFPHPDEAQLLGTPAHLFIGHSGQCTDLFPTDEPLIREFGYVSAVDRVAWSLLPVGRPAEKKGGPSHAKRKRISGGLVEVRGKEGVAGMTVSELAERCVAVLQDGGMVVPSVAAVPTAALAAVSKGKEVPVTQIDADIVRQKVSAICDDWVRAGLAHRTRGGQLSRAAKARPSGKRTRPSTAEFVEVFSHIRDTVLTSEDQRAFRTYKPRSAEVYGETTPSFVAQLIRDVGIDDTDSLVDIGSGIGTVLIQVAAVTGATCRGIELRQELHDAAVRLWAAFQQVAQSRGWSDVGAVELHCLDATRITQVDATSTPLVSLPSATVVYLCNLVYDCSLEDAILDQLRDTLRDGTRLVTLRPLAPRFRPHSRRYRDHPMQRFTYPGRSEVVPRGGISWTSSAIAYYRYQVNDDPNKFKGIKDTISIQNPLPSIGYRNT
jgi:hypothetical protein